MSRCCVRPGKVQSGTCCCCSSSLDMHATPTVGAAPAVTHTRCAAAGTWSARGSAASQARNCRSFAACPFRHPYAAATPVGTKLVTCDFCPQVTVSTVGLVDVLERFAASSNVQLALSLHATTDEVRDWIVPVNRRHNLAALTAVLRQHYGAGNAAGRQVLVEYTMLSGVNDTLQDAQRLVQLLDGIQAKVGWARASTINYYLLCQLRAVDACHIWLRAAVHCGCQQVRRLPAACLGDPQETRQRPCPVFYQKCPLGCHLMAARQAAVDH
eukprot:GHRQ01026473.1.p1 GENE.GHRQ01026473.1~~GHRQ01026473.1.p1  ORF type:complete len:270 (+),score=41.86 GHRQ01026473.1:3-812(+)